MALAGNPRVAAALALVRAREEQAEVAAAPGRPMGALYLLAPPPSVLGSDFNLDYALSPARLEFRQLLLDGGRLLARLEQARTQASRAAQEAVSEQHQLCLEVRLAYLEALSARARLELAGEALESARGHLALARARYEAGRAPRADVLSADLPVAEGELDLTRAQARAEETSESLARLIGLPLDAPLELVEPAPPPPLSPDLPALLAEARTERPWLKAARLDLTAAEQGIVAARKENNAELQAVLGAAMQSNADRFYDGVGLRAGLQLSWPFLDGHRTHHMEAEATALRDLAAARVAEAERQVEQEVRQAYRNLELAQGAAGLADVRLASAREALRVAQAQYEAGFVPFHAVRDARVDLDKALLEARTSVYLRLEAQARLDWALGKSP